MFIVWRSRPVKNDNRAMLLPDLVSAYGDEGVVATWKPLYCEHRGPGRVAWTPLAVHSERRGGKPRQKLLWRLPTIRSCCVADRLHRAAWWHEVDRTVELWDQSVWHNALDDIRRDRRSVLVKLREVVPPPTPAGVRDFTAYRIQKEREHQARVARIRAEDEAFNAEQRRREQEGARRQAEERRRAERQPRQPMLTPEVIAALERLGVSYPCSAAELKAAYRLKALETHPDQGGSDPEFIAVNAAYDIVKPYAS